jgi:hypothetical protein
MMSDWLFGFSVFIVVVIILGSLLIRKLVKLSNNSKREYV